MKRLLSPLLGVLAAFALAAPASAQEAPGSEPAPAGGVLQIASVEIRDGSEALDAAPAGREVDLVIGLQNSSESAATDVVGVLESAGGGMRLVEGRARFGDIAAGAYATASFRVEAVREDCSDTAGVVMRLTSSFGDDVVKFPVAVDCPGPRLYTTEVTYVGGDDDGVPEPGERLNVFVGIQNAGHDPATGVRATMSVAADAKVRVIDATASWPDIAGGADARNTTPFVIEIAGDAPVTQPCTPFTVDPVPLSDEPVSSDGGTVEPDAGAGSSGAGSAGSTGTGSTEPSEAAPPPTETETVAPDEQVEAPEGTEGEPSEPRPARTDEPVAEPDPAAQFEARLKITTDQRSFDTTIGSMMVCALTDTAAPTAGGGDAKDLAESAKGARNANDKAGALSLAAVLVAAAGSLVWRFRPGARPRQGT